MLTTKSKSPLSEFNADYYNNLKRISFETAEAYRLEVTKPKKETIDLGAIHGDRMQKKPSEREIRWIDQPEPLKVTGTWSPETVDLGAKFHDRQTEDTAKADEVLNGAPQSVPTPPVADPDEVSSIQQKTDLSEAELQATPDNPVDLAAEMENGTLPTEDDEQEEENEDPTETDPVTTEENAQINQNLPSSEAVEQSEDVEEKLQ